MSRVPCPLPHPGPPGRAARADDDRQAALSKLLQRQERRSGREDAAQQDERVGNVPEQVRHHADCSTFCDCRKTVGPEEQYEHVAQFKEGQEVHHYHDQELQL